MSFIALGIYSVKKGESNKVDRNNNLARATEIIIQESVVLVFFRAVDNWFSYKIHNRDFSSR